MDLIHYIVPFSQVPPDKRETVYNLLDELSSIGVCVNPNGRFYEIFVEENIKESDFNLPDFVHPLKVQ
jgi:hypothetical protein